MRRGSKGRPRKPPKNGEDDLLAEIQRLHAENEYLKKLQAFVLKGERRQHKTLEVQQLRQKYSLSLLLSIAHLPRATFYYHLKQMQKTDKYAFIKEELQQFPIKTRDDKATNGLRPCCTAAVLTIRLSRDLWESWVWYAASEWRNIVSMRVKSGKLHKSVKSRFLCRQAEPEVGHRCNGVQPVWWEALPVTHSESAQQRSGQLHNFRPSDIEHGDNHAGQDVRKDTWWHKPNSSFRLGLAVSAQAVPEYAQGEKHSAKYEPQRKLPHTML